MHSSLLRATRKAVWKIALSQSVIGSDQLNDFVSENSSLDFEFERPFVGDEMNFGPENPSLDFEFERSFVGVEIEPVNGEELVKSRRTPACERQ